ncbi:bifunctional molybdenum cofactor biosynthesis protein MoaC/MoaB [Streptomyces sp. SID11385]|uniref:bifunctional molybdenum cofactor biosynthesis protein MoaC/MoaB n=1 Tax=Streptomyces sp. SID11385 TaxID=2706031 RepID=UPI0013CC2632|nr:bifunctional molybdenum cofactor biosynthesis protein MoaC/MoaB [Streptomyces sp. SID11385]NEA42330.1 bifunctional molybdenum cofactor biosynthesis protein MoaC/MoaB [Streptomyces sp. SID11385]
MTATPAAAPEPADPPPGGLTHLDSSGAARMVDVTRKDVTARTARATGRVLVTPEVVALLRGEGLPKGDALATARIAGIMGAKRTPDLVPLCHPLALSGVTVDLEVTDEAVAITATVRTTDRTGVEMEALTAVSVAALTVVDMVKAVDKAATITDIRVETKTGGKSGDWHRDSASAATGASPGDREAAPRTPLGPRTALVVTASNRAAAGVYPDRGGPLIAEALRSWGFATEGPQVVPDGAPVEAALRAAVAAGYGVVVTTGGTGLTPTDLTPEATRAVLDREIPGVAEAIRAEGLGAVPSAALSRGLAGVAGTTLVVNLPGSTGGVRDGLAVLERWLPHAVDQIHGGDHRPAPARTGAGTHPEPGTSGSAETAGSPS